MERVSQSSDQSVGRRLLILGGARSGKSSAAESLAARGSSPVTMIATAQAFDAEMSERIARHRASRPPTWTTIEEPLAITTALTCVPSGDTVIIDCITVWLGNMLHHSRNEKDIEAELEAFIATMTQRAARTFVVSNEVGLGIVPDNPLSRSYRDLLGRVNARLAANVDRSIVMFAGRFIDLQDIGELS